MRSSRAASTLEKNGFTHVMDLGAMSNGEDVGLETTGQEPAATGQ